jgi:hypothetical protein
VAVDLLCTHVRLLCSTCWRYLAEAPSTPDLLEEPQLAAVVDMCISVVVRHNAHLVLVVHMYTRERWERSYPGLVLGRMWKHNFVAVHIQVGLVGMCRTALPHNSGERAGEHKQLPVAAAAVAHNHRGLGQVRVWVLVLWVHSIA